eukprot:UN28361
MKKKQREQKSEIIEEYNISQESYNRLKRYITPKEEFPNKKLWKCIGKGAFGNVYLVKWNASKCAVKIATRKDDISETIREAEMMDLCVNHGNVCRFLGVVFDDSKDIKQMWLITDFYEHGSLKQYIDKQKSIHKDIPDWRKYDVIKQAGFGLQ